MKIYQPNTVVSKYYVVLFKLPHARIIALIIVFFGLFLVYLMGKHSIPYIVYLISIIVVFTIYSKLVDTVFNKFRRILGLAVITTVYSLIIGYFISWDIGLLASTPILIVVLQGLDGTKHYRYLIALLPYYLTLSITSLIEHVIVKQVIKYLIASLILVLIDYGIYQILSRYKINGFKAPDLGTLFMWNWLEKRTDLDNVFEKLGQIEQVNPCILFNDDVAIVYTDIHYGPFSNIGSSTLPKILGEELRKKGYNPLVLHGMGSHDRNLASLKYLSTFTNSIIEMLRGDKREQKYYGAFKLYGEDNWEVLGLVFTDLSLIFISRPFKGIDDLPYDLQVLVNSRADKLGLGEVILIDSHNWERESELSEKSLLKLLDRVLDKIIELRKREPVEILTRSVHASTSALGVIDGEAYGVELKGKDGRDPVVIVYFRGNNMAPHTRNKIIEMVKSNYGKNYYVEVLTNDEHTETGIRSYVTYVPVQYTKELIDTVDTILERLKKRRYGEKLYLVKKTLKYPLLGENAFKLLDLLQKTYPLSFTLLLAYVLLTPLLLYTILVLP